jgi:hypothetical protein
MKQHNFGDAEGLRLTNSSHCNKVRPSYIHGFPLSHTARCSEPSAGSLASAAVPHCPCSP